MDERVRQARLLYERAVFMRRDEDPAAAEADPAELALFERAAQLYQELGDVSGESEALFWVGCFHQVVRRDNATALPVLERSLGLASQAGDALASGGRPLTRPTDAPAHHQLSASHPTALGHNRRYSFFFPIIAFSW